MTAEEQAKIYRDAVETYGAESQQWMIIEEMSELAKEICKYQRGADNHDCIVEEMADVIIMFSQAAFIYGIDERELGYMIYKKTERLRNRLKEEHEHS